MDLNIRDVDKIIKRPVFILQKGVSKDKFIETFEDIIKNAFKTYKKMTLSYKEYTEQRAICVEGFYNCTLWDWAVLTKKAFSSKVGALQVDGTSLHIPPEFVDLIEILGIEHNEKSCFIPSNKIYVNATLRERLELAMVLKGSWKQIELIDDANNFDEIKEKLYTTFRESKLMFLKGNTGSCKTIATIKIIKKYNCHRVQKGKKLLKVLYFSNRIVFARNTTERINEITSWGTNDDDIFEPTQNAGCYKDGYIKETVENNTFITQSPESLSKLYYEKDTPFSFSKLNKGEYIVVIDEAPELLKTLIGRTVQNKEEVCSIFEHLVYYAHKTIVMSDDLNEFNVDSIANLIEDTDPKSFIELKKRESTTIRSVFCKSTETAITQIFRDLHAGKNVFIPSVTISKQSFITERLIKEFGEEFTKNQCLFISAQQNARLAESGVVNGLWDRYRLVSISPKISSGVSFDRKHFHKAYVFTDPIIDIRTIKQMLGRVRTLNDNEVFHVLPETNILRNLPTEYDKVKSYHEDKANVGLEYFKQYFVGRFYHPKYEKYEFGSKFMERNVFQQLVEKHKEMNNFENEYVNHFIVECQHKWGDIDDYIFGSDAKNCVVTALDEAKTKIVSAKLKNREVKQNCYALASTINDFYDYFESDAEIEYYYEELKSNKYTNEDCSGDQLHKASLFLMTNFDRKTFRNQTYDVVEDYLEGKLDISLLRNFENFVRTQRVDESDLKRLKIDVLLDVKDFESSWVLQYIIKRLFSILWNCEVSSIEDVFVKIAQTWVFNPYRRVKNVHVHWLVQECKTLIRCCFGISQSTFTETILYSNKERKQYLFPHECEMEEFDSKKPFDGIVKEIVIFNILNHILQRNFGFSILKKRDQVRYRPEDLEQLLTEHPVVKSVKEYKEYLKLKGGDCRLLLYEASFDFERLYSYFSLSKRIDLFDVKPNLYIPHKKKDRVEKAVKLVARKRKREEEFLVNHEKA